MTKKQKEVQEKYVALVRDLKWLDSESAHGMADDLLLEALRELGLHELVTAYDALEESTTFYYA